jgi:hypothetical protein
VKITVIDVFRSLGIEPTPQATWSVGAAVSGEYFSRVGELPETELRTKTGGGGSHHFATYPEEVWRPIIEEKIKSFDVEAAMQGDLFGYGEFAT